MVGCHVHVLGWVLFPRQSFLRRIPSAPYAARSNVIDVSLPYEHVWKFCQYDRAEVEATYLFGV